MNRDFIKSFRNWKIEIPVFKVAKGIVVGIVIGTLLFYAVEFLLRMETP